MVSLRSLRAALFQIKDAAGTKKRQLSMVVNPVPSNCLRAQITRERHVLGYLECDYPRKRRKEEDMPAGMKRGEETWALVLI